MAAAPDVVQRVQILTEFPVVAWVLVTVSVCRKKTSTWWSTVAGCLSVGSPTFFRSGAQEFGEPGWWKLVQNRPPTLRPEVDKSTTKAKGNFHPAAL